MHRAPGFPLAFLNIFDEACPLLSKGGPQPVRHCTLAALQARAVCQMNQVRRAVQPRQVRRVRRGRQIDVAAVYFWQHNYPAASTALYFVQSMVAG